jgi:hypothetical protein
LVFLGVLVFSFFGRFYEVLSFLVVFVLPLFFVERSWLIFFGTSTRSGVLTKGFYDFMTPL